jgi:hypothetical protein
MVPGVILYKCMARLVSTLERQPQYVGHGMPPKPFIGPSEKGHFIELGTQWLFGQTVCSSYRCSIIYSHLVKNANLGAPPMGAASYNKT